MVIYMKHPVHGTKVAVAELEAASDEKNGWVRYTLADAAVGEEKKVRRRRNAEEIAADNALVVDTKLAEVA